MSENSFPFFDNKEKFCPFINNKCVGSSCLSYHLKDDGVFTIYKKSHYVIEEIPYDDYEEVEKTVGRIFKKKIREKVKVTKFKKKKTLMVIPIGTINSKTEFCDLLSIDKEPCVLHTILTKMSSIKNGIPIKVDEEYYYIFHGWVGIGPNRILIDNFGEYIQKKIARIIDYPVNMLGLK